MKMTPGVQKYVFLLLSAVAVLSSCGSGYKRLDGCHLEKMGIPGNVVKLETIVQSSIPLTELYANAFDPRYVVSMYGGNVCVKFDNNGNVKSHKGYGVDGALLYDVPDFDLQNEMGTMPCVPAGPESERQIDKIETVSSEGGKIVNAKYYEGDKLIWNQKVSYNDDGTPRVITKEYELMSIKTETFTLSRADTTTYNYLSYDHMGNWTEAEVVYKGILPNHAHSYKIRRQLTYLGEKEKLPLIEKLREYNRVESLPASSEIDIVRLGDYGAIAIPHYMASKPIEMKDCQNRLYGKSGLRIEELLGVIYDGTDAYSTISVNLTHGSDTEGFDGLSSEELEYDEEFDRYLGEQNSAVMAQGGVYVLRWLPYEFTTVSGRRALRVRYYRYGNGSPIPVYCETYTIPLGDGDIISVTYSFQSNLDYRFRSDFDRAVHSMRLFRE